MIIEVKTFDVMFTYLPDFVNNSNPRYRIFRVHKRISNAALRFVLERRDVNLIDVAYILNS